MLSRHSYALPYSKPPAVKRILDILTPCKAITAQNLPLLNCVGWFKSIEILIHRSEPKMYRLCLTLVCKDTEYLLSRSNMLCAYCKVHKMKCQERKNVWTPVPILPHTAYPSAWRCAQKRSCALLVASCDSSLCYIFSLHLISVDQPTLFIKRRLRHY